MFAPFVAAVLSSRARALARAFHAAEMPAPDRIDAALMPLPLPGHAFCITGPSGSGKSTLLGALVRRWQGRLIHLDRIPLPHRAIVDCFPRASLQRAVKSLASVGLAESHLFFTTPSRLSEGQRWRLRLALALAQLPAPAHSPQQPVGIAESSESSDDDFLLIADEFAALLDRVTASVAALVLRRAVRCHPRLAALIATSHDDLLSPLAPNLNIHCDFGTAVLRRTPEFAAPAIEPNDAKWSHFEKTLLRPLSSSFSANSPAFSVRSIPCHAARPHHPAPALILPAAAQSLCAQQALDALPLPGHLTLAPGNRADLLSLQRFHYLSKPPAILSAVWTISHTPGPSHPPHPIAVGVLSHPLINLRARDFWLRRRFATRRERIHWLNQHLRAISRIIVHPQFRALGLASLLVRHLCRICPVRHVEALALMGRLHPFFRRAGMSACPAATPIGPAYFHLDRHRSLRRLVARRPQIHCFSAPAGAYSAANSAAESPRCTSGASRSGSTS